MTVVEKSEALTELDRLCHLAASLADAIDVQMREAHGLGATITDLVGVTGMSRHMVRDIIKP